MKTSIKNQIDEISITLVQYGVIGICLFMNMLDGMDVMVISYAAPSIGKDWSTSPEALGIVFSAGLTGMTCGAIFLAPFADKIGRKKLMLIAGALMASCVYLTRFSDSTLSLVLMRFVSGLGIGAMLACTAALTAEFTPHRSKSFWVAFVLSGFPIGAVLSGLAAGKLTLIYGWRSLFEMAGIVTALALPAIYFFMSESLEYYFKAQPKNALQKANRILVKMGVKEWNELPPKPAPTSAMPMSRLMTPEFKRPTIQLWIILFLIFASMYFMLSWIPKLSANAGLSIELAIYAGTVFNLGAWFGIIIQGYFSTRFGLKKTIGTFLVGTALFMAVFTFFKGNDILLMFIVGLLGFSVQGGFVGLYTVAAKLYPTEFRSTGVGYSIGAGRLGGIIGPAIGGVLIGFGLSMTANFLVFAVPTLISGVLTFYLSSDQID